MDLPKRLVLPLVLTNGNALDLDLEHQFHSGLDFGLGGVLQHLERHGVGLFGTMVAFRTRWGDQHLHQTAFVELALFGVGFHAAHANISLSLSMAPLVTSTFL